MWGVALFSIDAAVLILCGATTRVDLQTLDVDNGDTQIERILLNL